MCNFPTAPWPGPGTASESNREPGGQFHPSNSSPSSSAGFNSRKMTPQGCGSRMAAAVSGKDGKNCCVGTNAKCEKKQSAEMEGFEMRPSDSYLAAHDEAGDPQRLDCAHRGG